MFCLIDARNEIELLRKQTQERMSPLGHNSSSESSSLSIACTNIILITSLMHSIGSQNSDQEGMHSSCYAGYIYTM